MAANVKKTTHLSPINIAMSAAESSADLLAASLIKALKEQADVNVFGLAGTHMQNAGCQAMWHTHQVNVMGFSEVLLKLPQLILLRRQIIKQLPLKKCAVFIGVDAPDFNLKIERQFKKLGIKTVHFVSPSLWAWRSWRVHKIKRTADLVLCLFPFEVDFYKRHQVNACFIGHPLADCISPRTDYQKTNRLVILPGSRKSEIKQHTEIMLKSAVQLKKHNPKLHIFIPLFNDEMANWVRHQTKAYRWIDVSIGDAHSKIALADAAIVASGTAALETALIGTPMVMVYKLSALSYFIAKKLAKTPFVSLPNIIAGKKIVPELLQQDCTPDNITRHVQALLNADYQTIKPEFNRIYQQLKQNSAQIAAKAILKHIQK